MTLVVDIQEAETHLSELIHRVTNGEQVLIVKDGRPVALLSGPEGLLPNRVPGTDMGALTIHDDFDAPLPEFEQ